MKHKVIRYTEKGSYIGSLKVTRPDPITRIFMKTDITDGCWLYNGAINSSGYGSFRYKGKTVATHRFIYETFYGPLKSSQLCCHKCDVRNCINPAHVFIGTDKDNNHDMIKKGRAFVGSKKHNSKLKETDIQKIFDLKKEGKMNKDIALIFNVTRSIISLTLNRKIWKHVEVKL